MSVHNARSFLTDALSAGIEASRGALNSNSSRALQENLGNGLRCPILSNSLQQNICHRSCGMESQELQAILQNPSGTPKTTFFGVSPPMRSGMGGAANPISHDNSWARNAYSASRNNLQVLRELECSGASFLQGDLIVGSPAEFPSTAYVIPEQHAAAAQRPPTLASNGCTPNLPFQCRVEYFAV
ncbi:hypothetical protein CEUSTIGMA_g3913.t1 [Chlamydomonas eustigma]|uniref:Uncharacterized protein n=1 Tax=Chlamydomonas eustigma TaxID=1157962 RepID=A0A250X068_9CHLO|nr:hypothetical protein CEUSTIGMA_g3913.t1 [Chlamydomonas eustigma]|eukprot:GAX76468.1 hypothetical protein CEUSTIGMA_g3913.t1 [Chlamydomonas eustigma]